MAYQYSDLGAQQTADVAVAELQELLPPNADPNELAEAVSYIVEAAVFETLALIRSQLAELDPNA